MFESVFLGAVGGVSKIGDAGPGTRRRKGAIMLLSQEIKLRGAVNDAY